MAGNKLVDLDGRTLEGGGQLLRNAICLSALTQTPISITDIRGNRSGGGGLKAQHLACVKWLAKVCHAEVEGAEKGSKTLHFVPRPMTRQETNSPPSAFKKTTLKDGSQIWESRLEIGTAGSTGLALQAALPFVLFTVFPSALPVRLTLSGGTNVSASPSFDYIDQVLLPTIQAIGLPEIKATLGKRGWSQGGSSIGSVTLELPARTNPSLTGFRLWPNEGKEVRLRKPTVLRATFIAPQACHALFRSELSQALKKAFQGGESTDRMRAEVTCEDSKHEKRMYLLLVAHIPTDDVAYPTVRLGCDWLYDRKISSHSQATTEMVERVVDNLEGEWRSGAWVDEHMRDQLVIFQALARGTSQVYPGRSVPVSVRNTGELQSRQYPLREPSLHTQTAQWVASKLLGVVFDTDGTCSGAEGSAAMNTQDALCARFANLNASAVNEIDV